MKGMMAGSLINMFAANHLLQMSILATCNAAGTVWIIVLP